MPDREKVISELQAWIDDPYARDTAINPTLVHDALALLKEQKAVEPRVSTAEQRCGHCNKVIEMDGWKACPWCGKMIDWERWWNKNGTHDNT